MPYIETKTSVPIPPETREILKTRLGQAIALLPGKSEQWLMLSFADSQAMYFQGDGEKPCAFLSVKILGTADRSAYDILTPELTGIIHSVLGIPEDRVYVQYEETPTWGWNGRNL